MGSKIPCCPPPPPTIASGVDRPSKYRSGKVGANIGLLIDTPRAVVTLSPDVSPEVRERRFPRTTEARFGNPLFRRTAQKIQQIESFVVLESMICGGEYIFEREAFKALDGQKRKGEKTEALDGLDAYSHVWVEFVFHANTNLTKEARVSDPRRKPWAGLPAKVGDKKKIK